MTKKNQTIYNNLTIELSEGSLPMKAGSFCTSNVTSFDRGKSKKSAIAIANIYDIISITTMSKNDNFVVMVRGRYP
jgi:hypothetical protein